jgi:hypothetical protein
MARTKCEYNFKDSGRQVFYDANTFETLNAMYPIQFADDFIGADVVIPASGSVESGVAWSKKIVGEAPPTVAKVSDGVNGFVLCSLTADDQKQDAAIHMNDELMFSIAQGAVFETRLAFTTLPTLGAVASFGLWGAWGDGGSAYRVGFEVTAGGVLNCESDDNATDTSAASGITLVKDTYNIFRVDCTNKSSIKFYVDGVQVCTSTTFANAASAANSKAQPHLGLYKASGAGLGVMSIDYVKVYQNRS